MNGIIYKLHTSHVAMPELVDHAEFPLQHVDEEKIHWGIAATCWWFFGQISVTWVVHMSHVLWWLVYIKTLENYDLLNDLQNNLWMILGFNTLPVNSRVRAELNYLAEGLPLPNVSVFNGCPINITKAIPDLQHANMSIHPLTSVLLAILLGQAISISPSS